jgi:hypothetical protein
MRKIDGARAYWNEIYNPDFNDFLLDAGNIRKAFHYCTSAYHLCEWLHRDSQSGLYTQHPGLRTVEGYPRPLLSQILANCSDFEYIHAIANISKHLELTNTKKTPPKSPNIPTHAANTISTVSGSFGETAFLEAPIGGDTFIEIEGTGRNLTEIATNTDSYLRGFVSVLGDYDV